MATEEDSPLLKPKEEIDSESPLYKLKDEVQQELKTIGDPEDDDIPENMPRTEIPFLMKTRGDSCFKDGDYGKAMKLYSKSILAIKMLVNSQEITPAELVSKYGKSIIIPCNGNLTLCCLNTQQYGSAERFATEVIQMDQCNTKAFFRRGVAKRHLKRYRESIEDLTKALDLDPSHTQAQEELKISRALEKEQHRSKNPLEGVGLEKRMGKAIWAQADRQKLEGFRGNLVLILRSVIDIAGALIGKRWYTEEDYEYY